MPPHVFALDRQRLRYARFHPGPRGLELREHLEVALDPGLFPEGPLAGPPRDSARLGEALDAVLERAVTTVREASLVLPDDWLRVTFSEASDVPARGAQREAVIRFKLRRLVPFRVEELRVSASAVAGIDEANGERLILGFALESLVAALEEVFSARGVRIGQISNQSLSLLAALESALAGADAGVLVHATPDGYRLVVTRRGEPILHRHKVLGDGQSEDLDLVSRDLRLTRRFVTTRIGRGPSEVVFVGPASAETRWEGTLEEAFEVPVRCLTREWGELPGTVTGVPVDEAAVLLGAASRRVS